jgi:ATP-binding cassette subfamily C (CFTR/MRP) protein 1
MTKGLVNTRQKQLQMLDQRVRLTSEISGNIRSLKLYAYEAYFAARILFYRDKELARVRKRVRIRATMQMVTVRDGLGYTQ